MIINACSYVGRKIAKAVKNNPEDEKAQEASQTQTKSCVFAGKSKAYQQPSYDDQTPAASAYPGPPPDNVAQPPSYAAAMQS